MSTLIAADQWLFGILNGEWQHPFLDAVMPLWRNKVLWIPLYLALLAYVLRSMGLRQGLTYALALGLCVGAADFSSSQLLKKNVQRPRPCRDATLHPEARLLVPCGGGYSFTSSHAANHFALAVFFALSIGRRYRRLRVPALIWAASIAYGQVYVGVHYPLDVLCGALLGSAIAYVSHRAYQRWLVGDG